MDRVLGVLCLSVVLHVVDRVLAAAVYQSSRRGIGGVIRIQLVAGVLISGCGNAALGNGNLCGTVVDPGCAGHFHLVIFLLHTVDGVVDRVLGVLCLSVVLLPAAGEGYVLGGHLEGGDDLAIRIFPADELVAGQRGSRGHCHRFAIGFGLGSGKFRGTGGSSTCVLVAHRVVSLLPDGVEVVGAGLGDAGAGAGCIPHRAAGAGRPAGELLAGRSGEAVAANGDQFVIPIALLTGGIGKVSPGAAVGMVGDKESLVGGAILGDEFNIAGNKNLLVGLIDGVAALNLPAGKLAAVGIGGIGGSLDVSIGAVLVCLAIHHGICLAVLLIGHGEGGRIGGKDGVDDNIAGEDGVHIEESTGVSPPADGLFRFPFGIDEGQGIEFIHLGELLAVGNLNLLQPAVIHHCGEVDGGAHCGGLPDGVGHQVAGGHGAAEIKLLHTAGVLVPAGENKGRINTFRPLRYIALINDSLLVIISIGKRSRAVILVGYGVLVAEVVELGAIVALTILCTPIFSEASNVIKVLISNMEAFRRHSCIGMMHLVGYSIMDIARFTFQHLNIIGCRLLFTSFRCRRIEGCTTCRHDIYSCLIGAIAAGIGRPHGAAIAAAGPLIGDVRAPFGFDLSCRSAGVCMGVFFLCAGQISTPIITPPRVFMFFLAADIAAGIIEG